MADSLDLSKLSSAELLAMYNSAPAEKAAATDVSKLSTKDLLDAYTASDSLSTPAGTALSNFANGAAFGMGPNIQARVEQAKQAVSPYLKAIGIDNGARQGSYDDFVAQAQAVEAARAAMNPISAYAGYGAGALAPIAMGAGAARAVVPALGSAGVGGAIGGGAEAVQQGGDLFTPDGLYNVGRSALIGAGTGAALNGAIRGAGAVAGAANAAKGAAGAGFAAGAAPGAGMAAKHVYDGDTERLPHDALIALGGGLTGGGGLSVVKAGLLGGSIPSLGAAGSTATGIVGGLLGDKINNNLASVEKRAKKKAD